MMKSVAIVGGGPIGLAAALALAEKGLNVDLFERGSWPLDKVCGEGIMPNGVAFLQKFGILEKLSPLTSRPFRGIRYINQNGKILEASFKDGRGIGIRRLALSQGLFELCQQKNNIHLYPLTEVKEVQDQPENKFVKLSFSSSFSSSSISSSTTPGRLHSKNYDLLIGCDGLRSNIRQKAFFPEKILSSRTRLGARMHFELKPWTDKVEVYWNDGIEAYICPVGDNLIGFTFIWDGQLHHPQKGGLEKGLFQFFPSLKERVSTSAKASSLRSLGPFARGTPCPVKGRVVLLGDAFLFLDGLTGEGLSVGFEQVQFLVESLEKHQENFAEDYLKKIRPLIHNYLRMTHFALFFTRHPFWRNVFFHLLTPGLLSHLIEVNARTCQKGEE